MEFAEAVNAANWDGTFQLELRCDAVVALSDQALSALIDVGCRQINMGIEKARVAQLNELRKKLSPQTARDACERLASTPIRGVGTFILGGPSEQKDDVEATIDFALSLPLDLAHFNPLAIYPGTTLYSQIFGDTDHGSWLDLCLNPEIAPLGDILWRTRELPLDTILDSVAKAYRGFYTEQRLQGVLAKVPSVEKQVIRESYKILVDDRARSWLGRDLDYSGTKNVLFSSSC